MTKFSTLIC